MLKKIMQLFTNSQGSVSIDDPLVIKSFIDNPDFPYLVSFSRTGSHWLRMIMELYFERPSLVRAFYFKNAKKFTCYHTHDMDLKLKRENVIYLYRDPVETVYSQLRYYKENTDDAERREHWVKLYARHLSKWLISDDFTKKKTVLTYEGMKGNMEREFAKVCLHFGEEFDERKLESVLGEVSKSNLKKKTRHDKQVVNLTDGYRDERELFKDKYSESIFDLVYSIERKLTEFLPHKI